MNLDCERTLVSVMALRDGEEAPLGPEAVRMHLESCESCRAEATADQALQARFEGVVRRLPEAALWQSVERRLHSSSRGVPTVGVLIAAAILVFVTRVACLIAFPRLAWLGSIPAIGAIALAFVVIRVNPFKVAQA